MKDILTLCLFTFVYGSIEIYSPETLVSYYQSKLLLKILDIRIKSNYANFGKIPYGTTLVYIL